jgi:hypothetical protein
VPARTDTLSVKIQNRINMSWVRVPFYIKLNFTKRAFSFSLSYDGDD